jgi:hypothetical protein
MKRSTLLLTTVVSLVLTGLALHSRGESARPEASSLRGADATSAAWHYFHGGARHWRNCLLHP